MLDADVLFGHPLRDTALTLAAAPFGMFAPRWSAAILDEVRRNLALRLGGDRALRAVGAMHNAFPGASVDVPQALIAEMPNHPKDRHVLATAVAAKAGVLVTRNVRDFRGADSLGVAIAHPDAFLLALYEQSASHVCDALQGQAAALTSPPMDVGMLLCRLEQAGARQFVAHVRSRLDPPTTPPR